MANKTLILLGSDNPTTWIVYQELMEHFGVFPLILETPLPRRKLLANRIRKLGLLAVASQIGFATLIRPFLRWRSASRIRFLQQQNGLESVPMEGDHIRRVSSVNAADCHALLASLKPDIVVVNGTRILSAKTLGLLKATVINTHQGITPEYRGAHGAYWALAQKDAAHCGVTVHLVDEGIDTGAVIGQALIAPEDNDNFVTYPYLQTAKAMDILVDAVRAARAGTLQARPISGPSEVWYHPGFFQYISLALRGVR